MFKSELRGIKGITLLFLAMLIISCSSNESQNNGVIQHPTRENLPDPDLENEYFIDSNIIGVSDPARKLWADKLENMQSRNSDGEDISNELFGMISDVEIDHKNRIYILDQSRQEVVVFNESGNYIATIAGEGKGPGELEHSYSMDIYNDEWLLIEGNFRIEVYDISGEEITFRESIQLDHSPKSICVIGDYLFLHPSNVSDEKKVEGENFVNTIHKYSLPDFEYLDSFGESYRSQNIMAIDRLSQGFLSCNESTNTVLYLFERFPVIHGYDADNGQIKWKTGIEGLKTTKLEEKNESGRTTITYGPPSDDYYDRLMPSVNLNGRYELVQIDRVIMSEDSFGMDREVLTFLIDTDSGEGAMVSKNIPIFIALSENSGVTVSEVFSQAKIQELGE